MRRLTRRPNDQSVHDMLCDRLIDASTSTTSNNSTRTRTSNNSGALATARPAGAIDAGCGIASGGDARVGRCGVACTDPDPIPLALGSGLVVCGRRVRWPSRQTDFVVDGPVLGDDSKTVLWKCTQQPPPPPPSPSPSKRSYGQALIASPSSSSSSLWSSSSSSSPSALPLPPLMTIQLPTDVVRRGVLNRHQVSSMHMRVPVFAHTCKHKHTRPW